MADWITQFYTVAFKQMGSNGEDEKEKKTKVSGTEKKRGTGS